MIAFASAVAAQDQPSSAAQLPTIVTSGTAVVRRAPDVAFVAVAVESRAKTSRDAQRENADVVAAVTKRLADLGIPRDALKTLGLWLEQQVDNVNGRRVPREFVARNSIEIRLDDVMRAGEIADAMVQAGATSLNGIRFDLKDRAAAEREALKAAVADARARADAAAAGAGRSVDRILKIEDSRAETIAPPRPMMSMRAEAVQVTDVAPGLIEIHASVVLTTTMK